MARGSSQSQTTNTASNTRPGPLGTLPRGSPAVIRRRRATTSLGNTTASNNNNNSNMLRFYTDDAPGLKITPNVVLVISLCFIAFVTALHVFGKLYRKSSVQA